MYGFHFLVWFLCVRGIKDTQVRFEGYQTLPQYLGYLNIKLHRYFDDVAAYNHRQKCWEGWLI